MTTEINLAADTVQNDYVLNEDSIFNIEAGCGRKTITLGENSSAGLNFITPSGENCVSDYQITKIDSATGEITIQRRTGIIKSISSSGTVKFNTSDSNYKVDTITISDYLTNGSGKVNFSADALVCYKTGSVTNNRIDSVSALLETIIRPIDLNNPTPIITSLSSISSDYSGSWLSENLLLGQGSIKLYAGDGNDKISSTSHKDGDIKEIHGGDGDDFIMIGGSNGKTVNHIVYGDNGSDVFNIVGLYGTTSNITLKDADSNDELQHNLQAGSKYSYSREGQDLIVTQTVGNEIQTVRIENHFDKYKLGKQLDNFKIVDLNQTVIEDLSLLEHAVIDVKADNSYQATEYKENIVFSQEDALLTVGDESGSTVVAFKNGKGTIIFTGNHDYYSYDYTGSGNDIIISRTSGNVTDFVTVKDYYSTNEVGAKVSNKDIYIKRENSDIVSIYSILTANDAPATITDNSYATTPQTVIVTEETKEEIIASNMGDNITINNNKDNVITTGNSENVQVVTKVDVGDGSNIIYLGKGSDDIKAGDGNNIIVMATNSETDEQITDANAKTIEIGTGSNFVQVNTSQSSVNTINIEGKPAVDYNDASSQTIIVDGGKNNITVNNGKSDIILKSGNNTVNTTNTTEKTTVNSAESKIDDINNINTGSGNDEITVGTGMDIINSGDGDDVVIIRKGNGNNLINGGNGTDTYKFTGLNLFTMTRYAISQDDSVTEIDASDNSDIIEFTGIPSSRLSYIRDEDNLLIKVKNSSTVVILTDYYTYNPENRIDKILTSDYTESYMGSLNALAIINELDLSASIENVKFVRDGNSLIVQSTTSTPEFNTVEVENFFKGEKAGRRNFDKVVANGSEFSIKNQTLYIQGIGEYKGTDYSENITALDEGGVISTGAGNDTVYSSESADMFIFNKGDGNDTIYMSDALDTIKFADVRWSELVAVRDVNDIILYYGNMSSDGSYKNSLTIKDYYSSSDSDSSEINANAVLNIITSDSKKPHKLSDLTKNIIDKHSIFNPYIKFNEIISTDSEFAEISATPKLNSWIETSYGNDAIKSVSGYNYIDSGDGEDIIIGGSGIDEIYAGSDDDNISAGAGDDIIFGGSVGDMYGISNSGNDTINGGAGNDTIWGGDGDDTIYGAKGSDIFGFTINADAGVSFDNDIIMDADKNDKIVLRFADSDSMYKNYSESEVKDKLSYLKKDNNLVITASDGTLEGTITINNFFKNQSANNIDLIDIGEGKNLSLFDCVKLYESARPWETYTGSDYNEVVTSAANATLKLGKGSNTAIFSANNIGQRTNIILSSGEKLNLVFDESLNIGCLPSSNGKDLVLSATNIETNAVEYVTVKDYLNRKIDAVVTVSYYTGDTDSRVLNSNVEFYNAFDMFKYNEKSVNSKGALASSSSSDNIDVSKYISYTNKGVNINSGSGNDIIKGSYFNDTVTSKFGNNKVFEVAGVNKINLGAGNDTITVEQYCSNTINSGDGNNELYLHNFGANKVSSGRGDDLIDVAGGNNVISVKGGNNTITLDGESINKLSSGKGADNITVNSGTNDIKSGGGNDIISVYNGANTIYSASGNNMFVIDYVFSNQYMTNTIKSGKGVDTYIISCGKNNISSGGGDDRIYVNSAGINDNDGGINIINSGVGNDYIELNAGVNVVNSAKGNDNIYITDGDNDVNLGDGNDTVNILSGTNIIQGGKGNDTYKILTHDSQDSSTIINDSAGNDTYDLSKIVNYDSLVKINDSKGKNTLIINSDSFDSNSGIYFDVIVGKNAKYDKFGNNKYKLGSEVILYGDINTLSNGIAINGRSTLNQVIIDTDNGYKTYKLDINSVAQDVANFLANKNYESANACIAKNNEADVTNLLNLYNNNDKAGIEYCLA